MITRSLLAIGIVLALASPAYAFHCPKDIKAIEKALDSKQTVAKLSDKQKKQVVKLTTTGKELHEKGDHAKAVSVLSQAMRIILTNQ